jgi:hypothetical protein
MRQPELYHRIKDDEAPNWFRVLIYVCSVLIFAGVLIFIMYAQAKGTP